MQPLVVAEVLVRVRGVGRRFVAPGFRTFHASAAQAIRNN
jgi:hypothetical protein